MTPPPSLSIENNSNSGLNTLAFELVQYLILFDTWYLISVWYSPVISLFDASRPELQYSFKYCRNWEHVKCQNSLHWKRTRARVLPKRVITLFFHGKCIFIDKNLIKVATTDQRNIYKFYKYCKIIVQILGFTFHKCLINLVFSRFCQAQHKLQLKHSLKAELALIFINPVKCKTTTIF